MDVTQLQQYIDTIGNTLSQLVASLQMPIEKIWSIMLLQNQVYIWQEIIASIILLLLILIYILFLLYWYLPTKKQEDSNRKLSNFDIYDQRSDTTAISIITGVGAFFSIMIIIGLTVGTIPDIIARIVNPEYMTVQDVIKLLQSTQR